MGVSVAEYYGQRTDIDFPVILPIVGRRDDLICPFVDNPCQKVKIGKAPVCTVRREDGVMWIVCPNRLCSTKKDKLLTPYQIDILHRIGKTLFDKSVSLEDVCVKREVPLKVAGDTNYKADFVITLSSGRSKYSGPDRLILEMQGGGETNSTGEISKHLASWANQSSPSNEYLRKATKASTLETNAWRRQQEQFLVKGNVAMNTWKGYGIAFCVGTLLFDYLAHKIQFSKLPNLRKYNWTLAIIGMKEGFADIKRPGALPIEIDETRTLFTNYQTFVHALINQGEPSPDAFKGEFLNLKNHTVIID